METAVDTVVKEFGGRLDIFVANSGTSWGDEAFIDADISRYHKLMKINADGVVYCARAAGKHFRRQKVEGTTTDGSKLTNYSSGSFIATASMSGRIVNIPRRQAAYNASKAHVIHLCKFFPLVILVLKSFIFLICLNLFHTGKSLAIEWLGFARVNSVSPGYVRTGLSGTVAEETMNSITDKIPMG